MVIYEKLFFFALGLLIGFVMSIIVACLEISSANDIDDVDTDGEGHDYKV